MQITRPLKPLADDVKSVHTVMEKTEALIEGSKDI
jgi:hypothetical protein